MFAVSKTISNLFLSFAIIFNKDIKATNYNLDTISGKIYIFGISMTKEEKSKIIVADRGIIIKKNKKYILRLFDGGITNINSNNTFGLNFSETDYDLSNFNTKKTQ